MKDCNTRFVQEAVQCNNNQPAVCSSQHMGTEIRRGREGGTGGRFKILDTLTSRGVYYVRE